MGRYMDRNAPQLRKEDPLLIPNPDCQPVDDSFAKHHDGPYTSYHVAYDPPLRQTCLLCEGCHTARGGTHRCDNGVDGMRYTVCQVSRAETDAVRRCICTARVRGRMPCSDRRPHHVSSASNTLLPQPCGNESPCGCRALLWHNEALGMSRAFWLGPCPRRTISLSRGQTLMFVRLRIPKL